MIKKLLSITKNKNKKHDQILMLAKSKLSSIETFVSKELIDINKNKKIDTRRLKKMRGM